MKPRKNPLPAFKVSRDWVKQRLADRDLTQTKLAALLQVDRSAVTHLLNGRRELTAREIAIFADALGVSYELTAQKFGVDIPTASRAKVDLSIADLDGEIAPPRTTQDRRTALPGGLPGGSAAVRLEARGQPWHGWTFFYEPTKRVDIQAVGKLAVCETANRRTRIGYLSQAPGGKWDVVSPWNGAVIAGVVLEWAAPVLQIVCL